MKADMAFPVKALSGTDRGQPERNWYGYRGQQCVRLPPVSKYSATLGQRISRQWFNEAVSAYQALTADQAEAWEAWADEDHRTGRYEGQGLTGVAAFVRVNWMRLAGTGSTDPTPPAIRMPYVVTAVNEVSIVGLGDEYTVKWDSNAAAGVVQETQILLSFGFSSASRKARKTDMRAWGGLGQDVVLQNVTGPGPHSRPRDQTDLGLKAGDWVEVWARLHSADFWPGVWRKFKTTVLP